MSRPLLLEIGTEEMPALAIEQAIEQLSARARAALEDARLTPEEPKVMATPRRLVLHVSGVAEVQTPTAHEVKGPAKIAAFAEDGTPRAPALGFAKSQGVAVDDLVVKTIGAGEYVFAVKEEPGRPAVQLLPHMLVELVHGLSFAKSMRWGDGDFRFVRPVRWLLALFGPDVMALEAAGQAAGRITWGHRLLAPDAIEVADPEDYLTKIEKAHVVLDQGHRAELIRHQSEQIASDVGGKAVLHDATFREVVQLVESPHVVRGAFDETYTELPRDVLVASMESHQRYFPVEDGSGALTPHFVVVHNGDPARGADICRGHERVLRARLADAAFFFAEDRKTSLADKAKKLKSVVYQEKLGSYYEKQQRIAMLAAEIARHVDADAEAMAAAQRASVLCKADLVTEMVIEFPTLQGRMGEVYARLSGETEATALAIGEHYQPRFAGDELPATRGGQIVSIADKLDSIVGCFGVGLVPTSSQDPYGLRRQALGIVTTVFEKDLRILLAAMIELAVKTYADVLGGRDTAEIRRQIVDFFHQRARNYLLAQGHSYDLVDAVLALGLDDLPEMGRRLTRIAARREAGTLDELLMPFGRAKNLSRPHLGTKVAAHLFEDDAEKSLLAAIEHVETGVQAALEGKDVDAALDVLVTLREPVDIFFDDVLVMTDDEDVRDNRLRLLNRCVAVFGHVADFAKVVQG